MDTLLFISPIEVTVAAAAAKQIAVILVIKVNPKIQ